ncbi:MAG TPA: DUF4232 domain-containing protein [Acidimicrobiales bacterium]|nr:DUF4232 domain-containing protein [Acidimicrobiales bacterium]
MRRRWPFFVLGVAVAGMVGCGTGKKALPGSEPIVTTTSISAAPTPPTRSTVSTQTTTAGRADPTRVATPSCSPTDLSASIVTSTSGTGHGQETVQLVNVSSATCTMFGYPGLGLLDPSGAPQTVDVQRARAAGWDDPAIAERAVTLAAGGVASFWIEWVNVAGSETGTLEITPPNQFSQILTPNANIELDVGTLTVSAVTSGLVASINPTLPPEPVAPQGPYADLYWPPGTYTSLSITIDVDHDPVAGPGQVQPAYFWATQFFPVKGCGCANGDGGYIGLQTDTNGKRIIFSWWSAVGATSTNPAAVISHFDGEGFGYGIQVPYAFAQGTTYKIQVTRALFGPHNSFWQAEIADTATGSVTAVGTIEVPDAWGSTLGGSTTSFTEFYGPRVSSCSELPFGEAQFGPLLLDGKAATSGPVFSHGAGACPVSQTATALDEYSQTVGSAG